MAYPYFNGYQPTYPTYQPQIPQNNYFQNGNSSQVPQMQASPVQGGFLRVQSEEEARRYPVTAGTSVTFIDDTCPRCYVKAVPISPMDTPTFKRYRLVEEDEAGTAPQTAKSGENSAIPQSNIDLSLYVEKADFDALRQEFDEIIKSVDKLRFDVDAMSEKSTKKMVQKARKDAEEE